MISGKKDIVILSAGSDGTDGPTDSAGGIVDGSTWEKIRAAGRDPLKMLGDNDSYSALEAAGALFRPGPTGTNVNDLVIVLA
jgi:hydroxypyruvate reductase